MNIPSVAIHKLNCACLVDVVVCCLLNVFQDVRVNCKQMPIP